MYPRQISSPSAGDRTLSAVRPPAMLDAVSVPLSHPVFVRADERPVDTMRADELRTFAERRDALYFPLPNGPKFLRAVLHGALRAVGREPFDGRQTPPQIIAAVHAMAQARRITTVLRAKVDENHRLREAQQQLLADARISRNQLHAAVTDYAHQLRTGGLSRERAIELVSTAVRESTEAIGAPELLLSFEHDAAEWVDEIYCVA